MRYKDLSPAELGPDAVSTSCPQAISEQYARERGASRFLVRQILEIADDSDGDVRVVKRPDGSTATKVDHENVHRARLRVDARKWVASKVAPKKYGDHA